MKTKTLFTIIALAFILVALPNVSAYKKLCLLEGQSIPPSAPTFTCNFGKCILCANNDYTFAAPYRCNDIPFCEYLDGNYEPPVLDAEPPEISLSPLLQDQVFTSRSIDIFIETNEESEISYIDNKESRPRWTRLCTRCSSYDRRRSFSEGLNDITFRATDKAGNEAFLDAVFTIDSSKPRVTSTEPRRGFVSGTFYAEFREDNPEELILHYGNSDVGMRSSSLNINSDCSLGRRGYSCQKTVDLAEYDSQEIQYWFDLTDITGSADESRVYVLQVDTTFPIINSINIEQDRRITLSLNITELNFDEVTYIDYSARRPSWRRLCSRLRDNICEDSLYLREQGLHEISLQVTDKAGNTVGQNLEIFN